MARCRIYPYSEILLRVMQIRDSEADHALSTHHSETDPVIVYNTLDVYDAFTGHPAPRIVITNYSLMAR